LPRRRLAGANRLGKSDRALCLHLLPRAGIRPNLHGYASSCG
jgi:hypothetical protein